MTFPPNPYQFSSPVYGEGEFFNRQRVLERLRLALESSRSIQLVGQFRIGKSSLLRYLQSHWSSLFENGHSIPIYYDMSRRPRLQHGNDFFARIWQLMSHALIERGEPEAALSAGLDLTDPFEFDAYLEKWVGGQGYRFVLLLDEFGLIASNKNFDPDFFDNLRSTTQALTYVLAAPRSLADFSHLGVSASPLWTVLQLIQVKLFEERQAIHDIIHLPAQRVGLDWPEEAAHFIYERGGQHPCYIQMAASALYDTYAYSQGQLDYKQADQAFAETATEHFRYLWTRALDDRDHPERKELFQTALLDLAHGRGIDEESACELENRGLVWLNQSSKQWEPFSAWFADWLRRQSPSKRPSEAPGPTLEEGQLVAQQYQVLKVVGLTQHSQVAKAWDVALERTVAIKCLRLDQESSDVVQRFRETLRREGKILAGLRHPYVGQVYTALLDPPGIVMEWVEGKSLQAILDDHTPLPAADIVKIGIAIADALNYVHQQNIFHRDIKPSNVILTQGPDMALRPVLIDFDIARAGNRDTVSPDNLHSFVGTPLYGAPEQFINPEGVGAPTDLFALGILMYELLTGQLPYAQGNLPAFYAAGQFPRPEKLGIPAPLYPILLSLLSQQPDKRLTAGQLRSELVNLSGAL